MATTGAAGAVYFTSPTEAWREKFRGGGHGNFRARALLVRMERRCFIINDIKGKDFKMLEWAVTFLVIALIAGVLGFGGIAAVSVDIAQIIFVVFLALFVLAALMHVLRGRTPPV